MMRGRPRKVFVDEDDAVKLYRDENWASDRIAEKYGSSDAVILGILRKKGVAIRGRGTKTAEGGGVVCPVSMSELIDNYESGESATRIANRIGVKHHNVEKWLKDAGVVLRGSVGNSFGNCDEGFFENIDTPEKAWALGWFLSDGCVCARNVMNISQHVKDEEVLHKLRRVMNVKSPVRRRVGRNESELTWRNKKMCDDLKGQGIVERKSLLASLPVVRDELQRHLIRGEFEGDGSVSDDGISTVGTLAVCSAIKEVFEKNGISSSVSVSGGNLMRVSVYKDRGKAMEFMYGGVPDGSMMVRKKKVFDGEIVDVVTLITSDAAEKFLVKNHYLGSLPVACSAYGWWVNGRLCGVAVFGAPSSPGVAVSVTGDPGDSKVFELRRFAVNGVEGVPSSKFLGAALRLWSSAHPGARYVVSYADESVGHIGVLYQAVNGVYVGSKEFLYYDDGVSSRVNVGRSIVGVPDKAVVNRAVRHKYVLLVNGARGEDMCCKGLPYPRRS